jgi:hypothetical protein
MLKREWSFKPTGMGEQMESRPEGTVGKKKALLRATIAILE